jgi:phage-related protein (TIGR01555 family)
MNALTTQPVSIGDGFMNLVTGLGNANGKTAGNSYFILPPTQYELEAAFRTSAWFRKIVTTRPRDSVRKWRGWQADKPDIELLEAEEKRLNVRQKVLQALIWEQQFGGAAIVIGPLPGISTLLPLELDKIKAQSIEYLTVLTRYQITAHGMRTDPRDPWCDQPEHFTIRYGMGETLRLHPSRVIAFRGERVSNEMTGGEYWGDSVWMRLEQAVTPVDASSAVMAALMQEAKVDIVRANDMMMNVASAEGEKLYMRRFMLSNMLKSVANTVLLDKNDEWDQKTINWDGIPEVVTMQMTIMAGAAGYPLTRLLGTQSKGLGNGGEADLANYYDDVSTCQQLDITPELAQLDEILIRSATGARNPATWYEWHPLWEMSETEKAAVAKVRAETAQIVQNMQIVPNDAFTKAFQNQLIESGEYPGLDVAIEESAQTAASEDPDFNKELPPEEVDPNAETDPAKIGDAAPRPLYVRRDVLNVKDIAKWAKAQGLPDILPGLHVTLAYSREPVDWIKMGTAWGNMQSDGSGSMTIAAGGPRVVEGLGDHGAVLMFASSDLSWRNREMREAGASWDYPDYQPHFSLLKELPDGLDLTKIEPYRGKIELGPEIFEPIKEKPIGGA